MKATIWGVMTAPEAVADSPMTPCTKSGVYTSALNIPALNKKVAATDTPKILLRKNNGLTIGSDARVSHQKKRTNMATEKTSKPMIGTESQAYSVPAQENASKRGTAAMIKRLDPAKSILCCV